MGGFRIDESIGASADAVWQRVRNFGNLDWMPGIGRIELVGEGVGAVRKIFIGDGDLSIEEKCETLDDEARRLVYSIAPGPLMPLAGYEATIEVEAGGNGQTRVSWSASYADADNADAMAGAVKQTYAAGLAGLKQTLE